MSNHSLRILIVDDDPDICANLADILSDVGYVTITALNGESALAMVRKHCPEHERCFDLCLLDFKMPGMDGVELLNRIHDLRPKLRAIMITAYAGDDGVQRARAAGTWKVLQKPVDVQELLGTISEAVL